jgi:hypothetical protein
MPVTDEFIPRLRGTLLPLFRVGSVQWKDNGGAFEARDDTDAAFVIVSGASPVGADDFVTLGSLSTLVTLQTAYNGGATITTASSTPVALTLTSGGFTVNGASAVDFGGSTALASFNLDTTGVITLDSSAAAISIGANADAFAINLGTAGARTITVGNGTGATSLVLDAGTGNIDIGANAVARSINLGTGAAVVQTIAIGGTGDNVITIGNTQTGGSIALGAAMTTGTITIGGTGAQTGTISIGTGTGAQALNFGTGGTAAKTVTIGSTVAASGSLVQAGTEGFQVNSLNTGIITDYGKSATDPTARAGGFQDGDRYWNTTYSTEYRYNGTAWTAACKAVLVWGNETIGTTTTARFLTPGYAPSQAPSAVHQFRMPYAGFIRNLRVYSNTVGVTASNITYTVRINGTGSALTCTYANTAADGSDLSNVVAVAAGDLIDIRITKSAGGITSPIDVLATIEVSP